MLLHSMRVVLSLVHLTIADVERSKNRNLLTPFCVLNDQFYCVMLSKFSHDCNFDSKEPYEHSGEWHRCLLDGALTE